MDRLRQRRILPWKRSMQREVLVLVTTTPPSIEVPLFLLFLWWFFFDCVSERWLINQYRSYQHPMAAQRKVRTSRAGTLVIHHLHPFCHQSLFSPFDPHLLSQDPINVWNRSSWSSCLLHNREMDSGTSFSSTSSFGLSLFLPLIFSRPLATSPKLASTLTAKIVCGYSKRPFASSTSPLSLRQLKRRRLREWKCLRTFLSKWEFAPLHIYLFYSSFTPPLPILSFFSPLLHLSLIFFCLSPLFFSLSEVSLSLLSSFLIT